MTGDPRVFIVQQPATFDRVARRFVPKYDLSPAEEHGRLVYLLGPGNIFNDKIGQAVRQLSTVLRDYSDADFILAVGDPVAIAAAALIAGARNSGRIKLLKWDRISSNYLPFLIETLGAPNAVR